MKRANRSRLLRNGVRDALAYGAAGTLIGVGAVMAQAATAAAAQPSDGGKPSGGSRLGMITVVGSRIPRTSIATSQPVITISSHDIQASGFTTIGQLLQSMTSAGASLNVNINNGSSGTTTVNLHQLGSKRTLVLVNGHRWPTTLGGSVDLSTIPTSIVARVEVLLDGASAIYGSDAISGVINIITINNFNGASASAYYGMYDAHSDGGGWDGKTQRYDFTVGSSNNDSSVLLSAGYRNSRPVWAGNRTISKEPFIGFGDLAGSSFTPGGRFIIGMQPSQSININGCGPTGFAGGPGCDIAGPVNGPNANPHPFTNADRYNYAPANYYVTPEESWHVFTQGHYDLTPDVTFNFTTMYQRRNSKQLLAPSDWGLGLFFGGGSGLNIGISAANPYNPFQVDLVPYEPSSPQYSAWCAKYGSNNGSCTANSVTLLLLGRRAVEAGNRIYSENQNTFYFGGGFTGYYDAFGNQWNWDAHYSYSQVLSTDITQGLANGQRLQEALGPRCASSSGCVPLNLFGGAGTVTPAMLNFIDYTAHSVNKQVMRSYSVNTGGHFYNGWYAGPWGAAAGYEYLEFDGFHQPDAITQQGIGGIPIPATEGRKNTNAQYVELNIPFASDLPMAKQLDVDIANRWSQFKWNGTSGTNSAVEDRAHASTGRIGIKWQPIKQLLLRGTWSEGFRVPSLSELFSPPFPGTFSLVDPCVGHPSRPNCPAHAVQPNSQIRTTVGGNPYLQPESAISRQAGFVWSPSYVPGLNLAADYYKIEVTNAVGRISAQSILDGCYEANLANFCSLISRTGGEVSNIIDTNINSGSFQVNGWDVNLHYQFPITPIGSFRLSLNADFLKMYKVCNIEATTQGLAGVCRNYAGGEYPGPGTNAQLTGIPKKRYNIGVDWSYGDWSAIWNIYLIGRTYESCNAAPVLGLLPLKDWCSNPSEGLNEIGTTVYHDVQGSYTISSWNTTLTVGVQNLFDKQPPIARTAFANSSFSYYRVPGRFFYAEARVRF